MLRVVLQERLLSFCIHYFCDWNNCFVFLPPNKIFISKSRTAQINAVWFLSGRPPFFSVLMLRLPTNPLSRLCVSFREILAFGQKMQKPKRLSLWGGFVWRQCWKGDGSGGCYPPGGTRNISTLCWVSESCGKHPQRLPWGYLLLWLSSNFIILSWVNNSCLGMFPGANKETGAVPCSIVGQCNNPSCQSEMLGSSCCPPSPMSPINHLLPVTYQWPCAGAFFYSWLSPSSCCLSLRSFCQANPSVSGINSQKKLREELSARSWLNASELSPVILLVGWGRQDALLE